MLQQIIDQSEFFSRLNLGSFYEEIKIILTDQSVFHQNDPTSIQDLLRFDPKGRWIFLYHLDYNEEQKDFCCLNP